MSCGCGNRRRVPADWEGPALEPVPGKTEAQEMLATPASKVEESRPAPPPSGDKIVVDYNPQPAAAVQQTPGLPNVFKLETSMCALQLGGVLPWNVVAFIVPIEQLGALVASPATLFAISETVTMDGAISGVRQLAGVDQFWLMRPGESIDFGRAIRGVAGFFAAPWSGLYPRGLGQDATKTANTILNSFLQSNLQAGVAAASAGVNARNYASSYDPQLPITGSVFAPTFRALQRKAKPVTVPWTNAAWVVPNLVMAPPNTTICIPQGARYLTVNFHTPPNNNALPGYDVNAAPYGYDGYWRAGTPLKVATGPWDVTVQWLGYDGLAHQHPADRLTAGARGQISSLHDIEIFEVPRSAAGLVLGYGASTPSGSYPNILGATYAFSGALQSA